MEHDPPFTGPAELAEVASADWPRIPTGPVLIVDFETGRWEVER